MIFACGEVKLSWWDTLCKYIYIFMRLYIILLSMDVSISLSRSWSCYYYNNSYNRITITIGIPPIRRRAWYNAYLEPIYYVGVVDERFSIISVSRSLSLSLSLSPTDLHVSTRRRMYLILLCYTFMLYAYGVHTLAYIFYLMITPGQRCRGGRHTYAAGNFQNKLKM